ncbi:MAG: hypothetical protein Q8781_00815 [Candidatus Phytoplasma stylosanthis]|uniref:hypothetical protein n=1 Tax=Candidatus Phytoplasma stylosanthis TaxID=2798314 RepID=UPI002939F684|nr:hypothetical protein [Candidatus Phytoplasma stylosanthis]MDV3168141.1 hypothetical protein [Candidatus Phytoplasma stylosanthis]MDV3170830.1 hypothetical protein [Candidatus Phytoplasma stylosanthis]MDV3173868.1 hypothetical protein [Candidatus Phytoplasma stylosanthis]MDV3174156.1 hypothetical protein [Candidatus Phytoplasma stylosanthis]MDV3202552.1 hypothetical protein [Candidatus Phytoplasma stylosanthis]
MFLDNLGAEALTPYLRDNILFPLLDMRYEKKAHTFINSNFDLPQLMHYFIIKSEEKEKMRALRIIHKLKKMCQFYSFDQSTLVDQSTEEKKRIFTK